MDRTNERGKPLSRDELVALHRHEWRNRDDRLATITHNLTPIVGVVALGWSGALTLWSLWLDGFIALGLGVALLMHRTSLDPPVIELTRRQFLGAWLALMGLVGLPYYIGFGVRWRVFADALADAYAGTAWSWVALVVMVAANVWSIRGRWRSERELVPRNTAMTREAMVHVVRMFAVGMLLLTEVTPTLAVGALAILYTYIELFPSTLMMSMIWHPAPGSPYAKWRDRNFPDGFVR